MDHCRTVLNRLPLPLLGLVLAYVLVVQAVVAPLHALASLPLAADHGLSAICFSHSPSEMGDNTPLQQSANECCELGYASPVAVLSPPLRGAGDLLLPPRSMGAIDRLAVLDMGPIPPERVSGAHHPPRAPPTVLALV